MPFERVPQSRRNARLPRPLLWGLVGVALLGLLAIAFLGGAIASKWFAGDAAAVGGPSRGGTSEAGGRTPASGAPVTPTAMGALPATSPSAPPATGSGAGAAGSAEVAAYFAALDGVLARGKQVGDPNVLARKVLDQMMSGDASGFEELLAKQQELADAVRQIRAPAACAEHHRRSLELMERGTSLLTSAREAIAAQDPLALASMGTAAQELESEARAVDALATEIRKRYGL